MEAEVDKLEINPQTTERGESIWDHPLVALFQREGEALVFSDF